MSAANFVFPIRMLSNSRVRLEPFDLTEHAEPLVQDSKDHPSLYEFLPYGPFSTADEYKEWYASRIERSPAETLFAIFVKTAALAQHVEDITGLGQGTASPATVAAAASKAESQFAGVVGLLNADPIHQVIEIGFIQVLRPFQRTFVASNAIGLLLLFALDSPSDGGLGVRRCMWQAHALNEPSRRTALAMGFAFEGVARFQRVLPVGKRGNGYDFKRSSGAKVAPARDTAIFAICCDEWEGEYDSSQGEAGGEKTMSKREFVRRRMARK